MRYLIPMAGKGQRFKDEGFDIPKPMIKVCGLPILERVVLSLGLGVDDEVIYVVRNEHVSNNKIDLLINAIAPGPLFLIFRDNEGQTQTCLEAKKKINIDEPLLIVNSDSGWDWDKEAFRETILNNPKVDGAAFCFWDSSDVSHWCFAKQDKKTGNISKLVEKERVSDLALCGGFYWRKGSDFVKYAEQQIQAGRKTGNGEYYLGPVFNEAIKDNKAIKPFLVDKFYNYGTPKEVEKFLDKSN